MMKLSRKILVDLVVGGVLSSIFCISLVVQIMRGGVGESITFTAFLSSLENVLYCLMMSMFIFASFLFRGMNNRVVVFCWSLVLLFYHQTFWWLYDYYYNSFRNIYMLIMAGLACSVPAVIILRYRVFVTTLLFAPIGKVGLFSKQIRLYLGTAKATDFEVNMEMTLYCAFMVEILYSLYMVTYGLVNQIPYYGAITSHLEENNVWDPFWLYYLLLNIVTFAYILILAFYIYRDNSNPDAYMHGYTRAERRQASLKVLEKYRKQAKEKQKNKRDED